MIFNKHYGLDGQHSFLSPSKYSWINYDEEKLARSFEAAMASRKGTELHALAHNMIRLGVYARQSKKTFNMYVNDALGYRMKPEQLLFFSENCFGTADAISYSEKKRVLRISDLKTGVSPTSEKQLLIYAALFCLEYGHSPFDMERIELRIYQNNEVREYHADPEEVVYIMEKAKVFDKIIRAIREEQE